MPQQKLHGMMTGFFDRAQTAGGGDDSAELEFARLGELAKEHLFTGSQDSDGVGEGSA